MMVSVAADGGVPYYPDLAGKVAVVTGGSRGIGAATCRALASNQVRVAVNGRDRDAISAVVAQITDAGGVAIAVPGDVTDVAVVAGMRDTITHEYGPVDILAAFAGGQGAPMVTAHLGADRWRAVIDSELTSMYLTVTAFLPEMMARGRGVIITMSSTAGRQPTQANAAYAAAKAGVAMFSRHLANEVGGAGVRVNCLCPAAVLNDQMRQHMSADELDGLARCFPLGRIGRPEDIAAAALYLASSAASWITGVTLDITGGRAIA
jgi:3-oxoacyl-[acyl-carrier protein] reductase